MPIVRAVLLAVALFASAAAQEPRLLFEETFTGKLDAPWSWLREDAKSWRMEDSSLKVVANGGSMWRTLNNYKNLLMRPAPVETEAGFQFEVLLENDPQQQFEHAGLACRYDDDNYVCFNKEFLGKSELFMISEQDAKPALPGIKVAYEPREVWLRLTVADGKAVSHYRATDKDPWLLLGEQPLPPSKQPLQIGPVCGLGKDAREARFRHFRVYELPQKD